MEPQCQSMYVFSEEVLINDNLNFLQGSFRKSYSSSTAPSGLIFRVIPGTVALAVQVQRNPTIKATLEWALSL